MDRYSQLKADMPSDDKNYCVPIALAIMADRTAKEVSEDMIKKRLRRRGSGVRSTVWEPYMTKDLGLEFEDVSSKVLMGGGRTVRTVERVLNPKGKYLIQIRGHLLAYADGKIQDWSRDRKHRPQLILMLKDRSAPDSPLKNEPKKQVFKPYGQKPGSAAVKKNAAYGYFRMDWSVKQVAKLLDITYANAHYYFRCWKKAQENM